MTEFNYVVTVPFPQATVKAIVLQISFNVKAVENVLASQANVTVYSTVMTGVTREAVASLK